MEVEDSIFQMAEYKESKYHRSKEDIEQEKLIIEEAVLDPAKFEYLYKKYYEAIFRFIYQRLDDSDLAFDMTSMVFYTALKNLKTYEHRGLPFSAWLYRIALNELNMAFRKNSSLRTINIESSQAEFIIENTSASLVPYNMGLLEALSNLLEEELYLVEMRFIEKRSFKEIAQILNLTENNAKVRLYRILGKLKKWMTLKG